MGASVPPEKRKALRYCYSRLHALLRTLEITDVDDFGALSMTADFATFLGTYADGFTLIMEPSQPSTPGLLEPTIELSCNDASLAIRPVFDRFQSVVITSGTLSPLDLYPKLLDFCPVVRQSFRMSMPSNRTVLCPMVVARGVDQSAMTTKFEKRDSADVVRNYGALLVECARAVPDGLVCFFTSYSYMERIVSAWDEMGVLRRVLKHKLLFIETKDVVETTLALDNYRRACDAGRGAVFLSVARGKVAEGVNFEKHYGRAVLMIGIPFQYILSRTLRARLAYLRDKFRIREGDFLTFDAMRQVAQCAGRVIRSKSDYGIMIFADRRFDNAGKRDKLPQWITSHMPPTQLNLSTDMAINTIGRFLRAMGQAVSEEERTAFLLDEAQARAMESSRSLAARAARGGGGPRAEKARRLGSRGRKEARAKRPGGLERPGGSERPGVPPTPGGGVRDPPARVARGASTAARGGGAAVARVAGEGTRGASPPRPKSAGAGRPPPMPRRRASAPGSGGGGKRRKRNSIDDAIDEEEAMMLELERMAGEEPPSD
jgi:DNA excision repair protein ERCC-2